MAYVEWSDSLSVGVEEIDNQHKTLVAMLNTLHEASQKPEGGEAAFTVVAKMREYAVKHFATEERYMNRYKYPGTMDHIAQHAAFVSKANALDKKDVSDPDFLPGVVKFLKQWLVDHISNIDIKMGRFLQEKL